MSSIYVKDRHVGQWRQASNSLFHRQFCFRSYLQVFALASLDDGPKSVIPRWFWLVFYQSIREQTRTEIGTRNVGCCNELELSCFCLLFIFSLCFGKLGEIVHCENLENMNVERNKTVVAWLVKFHREVLEFLKDSMNAICFVYVQVKICRS